MQRNFMRRLLECVAFGGLMAPVMAAAQGQTKATDHSAEPSGIADIVVTARRTEESLQKTPVSVTAFNSETLRAANIRNTEDLMIRTPGVYLSGSGVRANTLFVIRGQSKALSGPSSPAVVSYFAEVPSPSFASGVSTYDLANVQVLKGPQGTLFGRNTTGGAVLYYPTAPTYKLGGYAEATYGNYDQRTLEAAINLPIIDDMLAVRVAGQYDKRDGFAKNLTNGADEDNANSRAWRASLLFEPAPGIVNTTVLDYYRSRTGSTAIVLLDVYDNPSLLDLLGIRNAALGELAAQRARGPRRTNSDVDQYEGINRFGVTNRTEIDIGAAKLINIFGYRSSRVRYGINADGVPLLTSDGSGAVPAGLPVTLVNGATEIDLKQYSDEVQLRGSLFEDKLDWLTGAFYLDSNPSGPNGSNVSIGNIPGATFTPFGYGFYRERSRALFANLNYELGGGVRLNAGFRYTWDKVIGCTGNGLIAEGIAGPGECRADSATIVNSSTNRTSSSAPTWTAGIDWQANSDLFFYLVSRRGYRTGGINAPTLGERLSPFQSFGPEKVTDAEIGMRSDWKLGDVRIRFNASAFAGYYNGVQITIASLSTQPGCVVGDPILGAPPYTADGDCSPANDPVGGSLLVNGGKSRVIGIDFDGQISFTPRLAVTYGGTLLNFKTRELTVPPALSPYLVTQKIPFVLAAKTTLIAGIQYSVPLEGPDEELTFNGDFYHSGKVPFDDLTMPRYDVVNVRLGWANAGGLPIDVSAFVKNVFDKDYLTSGTAASPLLGIKSGVYAAPRTYGLSIRYRLGS